MLAIFKNVSFLIDDKGEREECFLLFLWKGPPFLSTAKCKSLLQGLDYYGQKASTIYFNS